MTKWETLLEFFKIKDSKDFEQVVEILHDDFLYLRETTLVNKEEFLEHFKKRFIAGYQVEDLKLICEDKDLLAWRDIVKEDGKVFETTNVILWKDDKMWRTIISLVDIT